MYHNLEELSRFRKFLIKNCKHLNTGKSPVFILISLIVGIALAAGSVLFVPKTVISYICIGVGSLTAVFNAAQLIYKKYI